VVSFDERRTYDGISKEMLTPNGTTITNWRMQLSPYESTTGPLLLLNDIVYFTSFRGPTGVAAAGADGCIGWSRIWGAHVRDTETGTRVGLPKPGIYDDDKALTLAYRPKATQDSLLLGLSISREPMCSTGTVLLDPLSNTSRITDTGTTGGGRFMLRTMVGGDADSDFAMTGPSAGGGPLQQQFQRDLPIANVARSVGWANSIE